jgi:hypothetical protein
VSEEFFDDPTVTDLIENNIQQVEAIEERQARRLLKSFRNVRQQLQDRLLTIPEGTFTEQQMHVTMIQIDAAIQAINKRLKGEMANASDILATRGINDLAREITRFSKKFEGSVQPLNIDMVAIATDSKNFLINKHDASIDAYSADLRAQIAQNITNAMIMRDTTQRTVSALVADVGRFFVGEEWKLQRIARTEMHGMYNFSKLNGLDKVQETSIPDLKKALMHPMDSRTAADSKKLAKENPVVDIDEPFRFTYKGKERVFMMPPDRPNDRAILVPFREHWGKRAAEFTPGE